MHTIPGYYLQNLSPIAYAQEDPADPFKLLHISHTWFRGATHMGFLCKRSLRERPTVNAGPALVNLFKVGTFLN